MGCVLRAWGKDFNVDKFLVSSSLEPLTVWHIRDPRSPISNPSGRQHSNSGMNVSVSERAFSDLLGQIEDAMQFVRRNREELRRLNKTEGVEGICLDFPVEDRAVAVQRDTFPPELLAAIGDLGIQLAVSRYPSPDKTQQSAEPAHIPS